MLFGQQDCLPAVFHAQNRFADLFDQNGRQPFGGFIHENQPGRAEKGRDRNALGCVLDKIDAALRDHVAIEERLMEIANFTNLGERQESHRAFQARLAGYRERFLAGQEIGKPLLADLKVYLTNHMRDEYRRYASYIL